MIGAITACHDDSLTGDDMHLARGAVGRAFGTFALAAMALGAIDAAVAAAPRDAHPAAPPDWAILDDHCLSCHNTTDWAGGLSLEGLDAVGIAEDPEIWEQVARKLRTGLMPPAGEPRPPRERLEGLAHAIVTRIDAAFVDRPQPGRKSLHRLNRTEYRNAIRDLLGYAAGVDLMLPADDSAQGFDNMADVLAISPTLVQAYVSAAMKISRSAVGDLGMAPVLAEFRGPGGAAQAGHVEGLPLGSRGGLQFTHYFPLDAEYEFRISAGGGFALSGTPTGPTPAIDVSLDGRPLQLEDARRFTLFVPAGPHTISVALVEQRNWTGVDALHGRPAGRRVDVGGVTVQGPYRATGAGDTPSRRQIFICQPGTSAEESGCARRILTNLATRAYRRPVAGSDAEVATLMQFYAAGHAQGGFEAGIQQAIARLLVDPRFLYRIEADREDLPAGAVHRISDVELASRLSFFLWSSIPDAPLLQAAADGRLGDPAELRRQVRRMLEDPKSAALVENFAGQWLGIRQLDSAQPLDPGFDDGLRQAMQQETSLLFASIKDEDRSVLELLDGDYTFLNERLAALYGIEGVRGTYMRRVQLPADSPRRGLLGKASILAITSAGNRTSPVMRGVWVLETLLGAHVPQPPPGVEADLKETPEHVAPTTVRDRLELHRAESSCRSCHQIIDPLGFALENFDLLGRWRTEESGVPVDAGDTLIDGIEVQGPQQLRAYLQGRSDAFVEGMSEKLLAYALGRQVEYYDQVAVRRIVEAARAGDFRFSALVQAIVESVPFQFRARPAATAVQAHAAPGAQQVNP